jgi:hypothetical protein
MCDLDYERKLKTLIWFKIKKYHGSKPYSDRFLLRFIVKLKLRVF